MESHVTGAEASDASVESKPRWCRSCLTVYWCCGCIQWWSSGQSADRIPVGWDRWHAKSEYQKNARYIPAKLTISYEQKNASSSFQKMVPVFSISFLYTLKKQDLWGDHFCVCVCVCVWARTHVCAHACLPPSVVGVVLLYRWCSGHCQRIFSMYKTVEKCIHHLGRKMQIKSPVERPCTRWDNIKWILKLCD